MIRIEYFKLEHSNPRLTLREFKDSDWVHVHKYASQEIVCQFQPWGPNTEEDSKVFVKQVIEDSHKEPRTRYAFAIIYEGEMVGTGEVNIRDFKNKTGAIAYVVNPDYWKKGIATEVSTFLITFGFEELQLHRLYGTCDTRNTGSFRVMEKVGMVREGKMREDLLIKDGWRDSFLYSMLESDFKEGKHGNT